MRQSLKGETEVEVRSGGEKRCEEMGEWRRGEKMRVEKRSKDERREEKSRGKESCIRLGILPDIQSHYILCPIMSSSLLTTKMMDAFLCHMHQYIANQLTTSAIAFLSFFL